MEFRKLYSDLEATFKGHAANIFLKFFSNERSYKYINMVGELVFLLKIRLVIRSYRPIIIFFKLSLRACIVPYRNNQDLLKNKICV